MPWASFLFIHAKLRRIIMDTEKMLTPADIFGEYVFNDTVMRARLSKTTYKTLKKTIESGLPMDASIAGEVASAMKEWAVEKGATHFTHWFQPMTGITAEKHDAFISPTGDGKVVLEFSGKELIKGEPDASSFPSGGLRATFEARGYTVWDCTSPAFVKEGTLYIPTAFFSYTGEALDLKTPLLRSVESLSKQAMRILKVFGNDSTKKVIATVGPEQEYFLVNRELYNKRLDLILTGRTLFGAKPPKGQELDDQYFGRLRIKINDFMHDLDKELWKLGITARTKHNEVAPAQHELAIIYDPASVASDHNQLVMEMIRKIAKRHGLAALLHEKPFDGVNGSGKHINWSLATDDGENLLEPGLTPSKNTQFLIFLAAVIKAVDEYADLIRLSVATAANDHRLGANEAPPAIISVFLGDELQKVIDSIEDGSDIDDFKRIKTNLGIASMPTITKDSTDRNRTSPFAFTGNKFEFRMCGSSANVSDSCFTINATVAHELMGIADRLEKASDVETEALVILKEIFSQHKRIIFNGNNYSQEWVDEAARRGLPNVSNTVLAIDCLNDDKNVSVYEEQNVLSRVETESRHEILFENYSKIINIEALTSIDMVNRQILPAALKFINKLSSTVSATAAAGVESKTAKSLLKKASDLTDSISADVDVLKSAVEAAAALSDNRSEALAYHDNVVSAMDALRTDVDTLEPIVPDTIWPMPSYADLLFRV
jgi:glutamine synthetase